MFNLFKRKNKYFFFEKNLVKMLKRLNKRNKKYLKNSKKLKKKIVGYYKKMLF